MTDNADIAKILKRLTDNIDQHNANCEFPVHTIVLHPDDVERIGWDEFKGIPIKGDESRQRGTVWLLCDRPTDEAKPEESVEAISDPSDPRTIPV